jgi:hypothetical protein
MSDQAPLKLIPETAESRRSSEQTQSPTLAAADGSSRLSDLLMQIERRADPEVFSLLILDLARFLRPRLQTVVQELQDLQRQYERECLRTSRRSIQ